MLKSLFNKVAGKRKKTPTQVFSCKICKFLKKIDCQDEAIKTISSQFKILRKDFERTKSTKTQSKRFPPS